MVLSERLHKVLCLSGADYMEKFQPGWDFSPATVVWKEGEWFEQETRSVEISQVVTNMQHKTNIFRCVFQINHIYYFFIAFHKALSVFHTSCFLFKTFPPSFPSPSSRAEITARTEISPCIRPLRLAIYVRYRVAESFRIKIIASGWYFVCRFISRSFAFPAVNNYGIYVYLIYAVRLVFELLS